MRLFAVGAGYTGGPRVQVYDEEGVKRFDFFAFEHQLRSGVMVATADVNGDLVEDIIVAPGKGIGSRYEYSVLVNVPDPLTGVLIPTLQSSSGNQPVANTGGPRVRILSGTDLGVIADFFAFEPEFRGGVRLAAGDLDGDGKAEVFVAAGDTGGPRIVGFRFDSGGMVPVEGPLANFFAFDPGFRNGATVAAGDLDGDGKAELIVGSPEPNRANQQVKVYGSDGAELVGFAPFADLTAPHRFDVGVLTAHDGAAGSILAGTVDGTLIWRTFEPLGLNETSVPTGWSGRGTQSGTILQGDPGLLFSDVAGIEYQGKPSVIAGFFNNDPLHESTLGAINIIPSSHSIVRIYPRAGGDPLLEFQCFENRFIGGVSVG